MRALVRETFSVAGNMLAGPQVIEATAHAYAATPTCPSRAGCSPRCRPARRRAATSAASSRRRCSIYDDEEYPTLDMRVDDHADPLAELARLEKVSRERYVHFRKFLPTRDDPAGVIDRDAIEAGIAKALAAERESNA